MDVKRCGRPNVGDVIKLANFGRCTVVSNSDPSVITLETENGATLKIGEKVLALMLLAANGEDARPTT